MALGCKTSEVALTLLCQVVRLENPDRSASEEKIHALLMNATAMLAELEPKTATEALLAAQMVGVQRLVMLLVRRAALDGQTAEGVDANVLGASRLMRVFNGQLEAMAKLKDKAGQQRVVVEHVTVNQGGQASSEPSARASRLKQGGWGMARRSEQVPHAQRRGWLKNGNPPVISYRRRAMGREPGVAHRVAALLWAMGDVAFTAA